MIDTLLVLNAGSSSIKFQIFGLAQLDRLAGGQVSRIGGAARLEATVAGGATETGQLDHGANHEAALAAVLGWVTKNGGGWKLAAVVHRIVHGGERFAAPVIITPAILAELAALAPLAPLHQPHNLAGVAASARLAGEVPDIACFDTAFHAGRDELFRTFAVRAAMRERGIWRFGFHGISYQWIARALATDHPDLADARVIVAHLGNGASLCAMQSGRSIDTTMGMTALDGLPMGTRSGAIDPGALIYMMRDVGMTVEQIEAELYERSGLLGLSGLSNDVKTLLESGERRADFALDYFSLKVAQYAAMMVASLGGVDALVFTGGIGEHAAPVREAILDRLAFLRPFQAIVIATNEEKMMAIEAKALLEAATSG